LNTAVDHRMRNAAELADNETYVGGLPQAGVLILGRLDGPSDQRT